MRAGDEIVIEPGELVAGGDAMARVDGMPLFVPGIYPGDVARVRITEVKKGFARAELVRVEQPSALRRAAPCPIAGECGGCDWTVLRLDAQLAAKERILRESLRRIGKMSSIPPIVIHPSPLNYRLRSRLHRDGDAVGFYAMRSNRVVPLARECEVVGVRTALECGGAAAAFDREKAAPPPNSKEIWEVDGRVIPDDEEITLRIGENTYRLSTGAFFQVNRHLLQTMLTLVTHLAGRGALAVDLYAGVGFFTLPLTKLFDRVIAVEGSPLSSRYLRLNTTAECVNEPVEQYVARMPEADFIFLDPPRAGARREVIDAVAQRARRVVCHLACDPVLFARDANRLIAAGWRLATLDLLDLFPNTHHVETLASFERAR